MAWQLKSSAKIALISIVMLIIGFLICYGSTKWYSSKSNKQARVFSDMPTGEVWVGKREVTSSESDYFEKLFDTTKVIVVRSWIKYPQPPIYRVISTDEEINNIIRATTIKYQRDPQPIHPSYQLFFITANGDYMMNYERIPPDGSVIDVIPGTAEYDNYGRIVSFQRQGPGYKYIQAYPSPELQCLIDKYVE